MRQAKNHRFSLAWQGALKVVTKGDGTFRFSVLQRRLNLFFFTR